MVSKALQSPERVKQVWDKIRAEGLLPTMDAVFAKLDQPMPLGYSNAGLVVEVGPGVTQFAVGDRVASNGGHAEMVSRPVNLCAKIPAGVSDEQASFAVLGSIGLQGIRLLRPDLGETVAVFGLGLIGLLAVQLLAGSGARVLGIDPDPARRGLAAKFGAIPVDVAGDPVAAALANTKGQGVDAVLVTASARDDDILSQAAHVAQTRPHCPGGRGEHGAQSRRVLRERAVVSGLVLLRARPLRPSIRRAGGRLSLCLCPLDRAAQYRGGARYARRRPTERRPADHRARSPRRGRPGLRPPVERPRSVGHRARLSAYLAPDHPRGANDVGADRRARGRPGKGRRYRRRRVYHQIALARAQANGRSADHDRQRHRRHSGPRSSQVRIYLEHHGLSHDPGRSQHQLRIHYGATTCTRS